MANLNTILQQADVPGTRVLSALGQAVLDGVQAHVVAFLAEVKTFVQLFRQVFVNIVHNFPFSGLFFVFEHPRAAATSPPAARSCVGDVG